MIYHSLIKHGLSISCNFISLKNILAISLVALQYDAIDEALYFFKANIFFKNYEIKVSITCTMARQINNYNIVHSILFE